MCPPALDSAIPTVPPGRWGVAVSGGADSVALLRLLLLPSDLSLHIIHLDHQTRGAESTADAEFVRRLANELQLPSTIERRDEVEQQIADLPANPSARYRAARLTLFRNAVAREHLAGVILAHHADDQAETVLHRLIRGSGPSGLAGMSQQTSIAGLTLLRPLLSVRRTQLRSFLQQISQSWREDASNASDDYLRNRLRRWLSNHPEMHDALIALADACRALRDWTTARAPELPSSFYANQLAELPDVLAHESARRWFIARGAPPDLLTEDVLDRLVEMARDAATPARADFPGALHVRRRQGIVSIAQAAP